jgi:hypothetical protein
MSGTRCLAVPGVKIQDGGLLRQFFRARTTGSIMADDDSGSPLIIEIRLNPDATPLDFLTAVYRHSSVPLGMRLQAAMNAAQYIHPKLVAIAAVSPGGERFEIKGGLPALPGAPTIMPGKEGPIIDAKANVEPMPEKKPAKPKPKTPADEPVEP